MKKTINVNDKVRITGKSSGHSQPINTEVTICRINNGKYYFYCSGGYETWAYAKDLEPSIMTKEDIDAKKKELKEQIKQCDSMIAFMKETESDKFDPLEFKCYEVMKEANNAEKTPAQKAKAMAKLIREN